MIMFSTFVLLSSFVAIYLLGLFTGLTLTLFMMAMKISPRQLAERIKKEIEDRDVDPTAKAEIMEPLSDEEEQKEKTKDWNPFRSQLP